ncbi:unnamed protein product [Closterium sp. NIES-65]|nr:unnamed protein product [Closterium sp. NIES-65]
MPGPNKPSCRSSLILILVLLSLLPSFNVSPTMSWTVTVTSPVTATAAKVIGAERVTYKSPDPNEEENLEAALGKIKAPVQALTVPTLRKTLAEHSRVLVVFFNKEDKAFPLLVDDVSGAKPELTKLGVTVAMVDGVAAGESVREEFKAYGDMPNFVLVRDGVFRPIRGYPESDELVTFVKKRLGLSVTHLSASEAHKAHSLLAASNAIALALLHSLKGPEAEAFAEASRDIDDIEFIATTDANIAAEFRIVSKERPTVAVIKKEDEKFVAHDGPFTSSAIAAFVTANKLPLVTTYDEESQYTIFNSDIKKQVLLLATNGTYPQHLPVVKEAAMRVKGLALFVYINSDLPESEHALEYFGFRHGDTAIMGMESNETDEVKFKFNGQITTDDIEAFARELAADRVEPYYLSDPIPEKNDGPVLTVVGKNFKEIVMDRTKDVLLKIDVDHCQDCTDLDPTFKKLALKFSDVPSLVFARMNARNNEYPGLEVSAFPTLLLYPANRKSDPIDTHHTRLGPLTDFVVRNSAIPVKMPSEVPPQRPSQRSRSKEEAEEEKELRRDLEEAKAPKKGDQQEIPEKPQAVVLPDHLFSLLSISPTLCTSLIGFSPRSSSPFRLSPLPLPPPLAPPLPSSRRQLIDSQAAPRPDTRAPGDCVFGARNTSSAPADRPHTPAIGDGVCGVRGSSSAPADRASALLDFLTSLPFFPPFLSFALFPQGPIPQRLETVCLAHAVAAVHQLTGPIPQRLETVCLAHAVAAVHQLTVRVLWLSDEPPASQQQPQQQQQQQQQRQRAGMPYVPFSALFEPALTVVETNLSAADATRRFIHELFTPKARHYGPCFRDTSATRLVWAHVQKCYASGVGARAEVLRVWCGGTCRSATRLVWAHVQKCYASGVGARAEVLRVWCGRTCRSATRLVWGHVQKCYSSGVGARAEVLRVWCGRGCTPHLPLLLSLCCSLPSPPPCRRHPQEDWQEERVGCLVWAHVQKCYARLQPSPAVAAMVREEGLNQTRVDSSIGVYLDATPRGTCPGCPSSLNPSDCAARTLALTMLHRPSIDFTLGSAAQSHPAHIVSFFDADRAPYVSPSAAFRAANCGEKLVQAMGEKGEGAAERLAELVLTCKQREVADLFLLAQTTGLVVMEPSTLSDFIAARGRHRLPSFRLFTPLCLAERAWPMTVQPFAYFFAVEPTLGIAYCSMPKVACTGWKMWLRAMLGLPKPRDPFLAHSHKTSGLGDLSQKYSEKQATKLMTRRTMFKFTFVRNPYVRIASTYLNKLVITDAPERKEGWGTRKFWNQEFFGTAKRILDLLKDPATDLVSFPDFIRLLDHLRRTRVKTDRHISRQVDICGLAHVQYDFVGRFEHLEEDVRRVTARFNDSHLDIFNFGKSVHATNSEAQLARLYDRDTVLTVSRIFKSDLNVPLNNITYDMPDILRKLVEGGASGDTKVQ